MLSTFWSCRASESRLSLMVSLSMYRLFLYLSECVTVSRKWTAVVLSCSFERVRQSGCRPFTPNWFVSEYLRLLLEVLVVNGEDVINTSYCIEETFQCITDLVVEGGVVALSSID